MYMKKNPRVWIIPFSSYPTWWLPPIFPAVPVTPFKPNGKPYHLGFFLVGAYQESLANEHNLFGAIHEVEVILNEDNTWSIQKTTHGDPIIELLICRNYDQQEILSSYLSQLKESREKGLISEEEANTTLIKLEKFLHDYPYLKEPSKH